MNGGWFSQCGRERLSKPKPVLERVEIDIVPIQSTPSLQRQPSEISQPTPSSTLAPQTPSLRHPNNTAPVVSGSQVEPGAILLTVTTNSTDTPSNSPTLASLQRGPSQPAKVHKPRPSVISEGVSEPTHMDLDHPTTLPARVPGSKPPILRG